MTKKTRVGFIGVGLMGHGAAKNILERGGYPLTILGIATANRSTISSPRGAAKQPMRPRSRRPSEVVILCLPSSAEVEAIVYGDRRSAWKSAPRARC